MNELQDRIVFITGAASGMGRASAVLMALEGATVIVADRDDDGAKSVVAEIEAAAGDARALALDVTDVDQIKDAMAFVEREFGRLDVLFANAGTPGAAGRNVTLEEYNLSIGVNMTGAYFAAQFAIPLLEASPNNGSIIFTSSTSGITGSGLSPLYSMAKGGVVLLAKSLAIGLAPKIRVNVICPGPIDTPMLPKFWSRQQQDGVQERLDAWVSTDIPMKRRGRPEEIAHAAMFLASDRSSYITGVALPVDGGFLAK
jgi:NAD(P)-dependent dehydrogenase (short-subunit alcohol dehydrogenase family)